MTEWIWSCDPAISHLAFAFADLTSDTIHVESLNTRTDEREGARLGHLDREVRQYAAGAARRYPPACVWVESPGGRYVSPHLRFAVGALAAALYESLAVPVWFVPPSAWKKRALGYGNATKEAVRAHVEGLGLHADTQDECDAICIAISGRKMFQERAWEAAA